MDPIGRYVYTALPPNHIRLLYPVTLSSPKEQLTWSLQLFHLSEIASDEQYPFEALSYTWGDFSISHPLVCQNGRLDIHHNLHLAMPYLRCRPSTLPLWIDAICINQEDELEKESQIRHMHEIYKKASRVWIWFGVAEEPAATEAIEQIIPRMKEVGEELEPGPGSVIKFLTTEELGLPSVDSASWLALESIVQNPWFRRLWIVQEFSLAHDVIYLWGHHVLEHRQVLASLTNATHLQWIQDMNHQIPSFRLGDSISNIQTVYCRVEYQNCDGSPDSLLSLATSVTHLTREYSCSDPRDRVLALLGFLGGQANRVNIDENITIPELYCEYHQTILHHTGGLPYAWWAFFSGAIQDEKNLELPSWCPDLQQNSTPIDSLHHTKTRFLAANKERKTRRGRSLREIVLRGTFIDVVGNVEMMFPARDFESYDPMEELSFDLAMEEWMKTAENLISGGSSGFNHVDNDKSALNGGFTADNWLTMLGGLTQSAWGRPYEYDEFVTIQTALAKYSTLCHRIGIDVIREYYKSGDLRLKSLIPLFDEWAVAGDELHNLNGSSKLMNVLKIMQENKTLFVTIGNRFGFLRGDVMPGDRLCAFDGAYVPYILRKNCDGGEIETYSLVGEAYVHGIMQGEIESWDGESQDITLI